MIKKLHAFLKSLQAATQTEAYFSVFSWLYGVPMKNATLKSQAGTMFLSL
jgi:hypothetical protein